MQNEISGSNGRCKWCGNYVSQHTAQVLAEHANFLGVELHDIANCSDGLCKHPKCIERNRSAFAAQQLNR